MSRLEKPYPLHRRVVPFLFFDETSLSLELWLCVISKQKAIPPEIATYDPNSRTKKKKKKKERKKEKDLFKFFFLFVRGK